MTATKKANVLHAHRRQHGRITHLARCSPHAHRLNVRQQALHAWFYGSRRYHSSKLEGQGYNKGETFCCGGCCFLDYEKYVPSGGVVMVYAPGMSRGMSSAQGSTTAVHPQGFGSNAVQKHKVPACFGMVAASCNHRLCVFVCHTILFAGWWGHRVAQDRLAPPRPAPCLG